jgi:hypothetical protein
VFDEAKRTGEKAADIAVQVGKIVKVVKGG